VTFFYSKYFLKQIITNTHEMNFTTMTPLRCYEIYVASLPGSDMTFI